VAPGSFALRVTAAAGDLRPGDVVTSVAGAPADPATWRSLATGTRTSVWSGGALREAALPPGVVLRPTWQPAFLSESTVAGTSPLRDVEIEEGIWLLVAEAPGRESVLHPCAFGPGQDAAIVELSLPPCGTTPAGFAAVQPQCGETGAFALQEREVTCAEYLEFLNEPETLARIAASREAVLFPRSPPTRLDGGLWTRDASGRFALPADFPPDWPVIGVSFDDARAYAAWRTARAAADGNAGVEFALPTKLEWIWAGGFRAGRLYVFGHRFERRWTNGCWARPTASPLPVMSCPVDESPYGVYDMAGNTAEWVDDWYAQEQGLRLLAGGSWGQTDRRLFEIFGGIGLPATAAGTETGFRLVARRRNGPR
jgi:hypothetical protein